MGSPAVLEAQIRELQEKSLASAAALRTLVHQGESLEARVQSKRTLRPLVSEMKSEGEALERRLADSSTVVQRVVESVRTLDLAQANTRRALERVQDIVGLKTCVDDVAAAIVAEDWEKASGCMQRYLNVNPEDSNTRQEEAALQSLRKSLVWLRSMATEKCQDAIDARDEAGVVRFCKLMTSLNMASEGAARFAQFMGKKVQQGAEDVVDKLRQGISLGMKGGNTALYAGALTSVLELVAKTVAEGEAVVRESFEEEPSLQLVSSLYGRAAPSISEVLSMLYENKNVGGLVKKYRDQGQIDKNVAMELDVLLDEVAICLQRLEQFTWFLHGRAASKASGEETKEQQHHALQLLRNNTVEVQKAKLISGYIPLEESFMRHSVEKAIKTSDRDDDNKVSSLVDEVFFVLKRCTHRAVQTSSLNAMGDVIMYVNTILVTTYKEALEQLMGSSDSSGLHISGGIANLFRGTAVGGHVSNLSMRQVLQSFDGTCYNNMEVSAEYIVKLHESLEAELRRVFGGANRRDEDKARECMSELTSATSVIRKSLQDAVSRLASVLGNFFQQHLQAITQIDYEDAEGGYAESPAVAEFVGAVESTIDPFRDELNAANFDSLVLTIVDELVVPALEKLVLGRKAVPFSQLGAMQFDKDLRALTAFFSGLAQRAVRDRFTRLTQMSIVLNLEDPTEIWEYNWGEQGGVGSAAIVWRLSADEMRKVMERRIEWSKERLAALKL